VRTLAHVRHESAGGDLGAFFYENFLLIPASFKIRLAKSRDGIFFGSGIDFPVFALRHTS
jgi:hypothetical protein